MKTRLLARTAVALFWLVSVSLVNTTPETEAWSISGHEIIVSRACRLFPGQWGDFFRYYEWLLNDTVAYPDTFYKARDPTESPRHFIDLEIWNESRPETGTLPFAVEQFGRSMLSAIQARDWNRVLLDAGRLAHYISDICQPYHSTVNYDPATKSGTRLHAVLDGVIRDHLTEIVFISSVGALQTVNFTEYALFLAQQSHSFLAEINSTLIDENFAWSPRLTEIIENRTNTAIIATINVWHTAVSASGLNAPMLAGNRLLRIVATSTFQTMDISHDNTFEFIVTDQLGVQTVSDIRAEIGGLAVETESHQDLTNPLISYRMLLPSQRLKDLRGTVQLNITAARSGYFLGCLTLPIKIEGQVVPSEPPVPANFMIYVAIAATVTMLLSSVLLSREYGRRKTTSDN